MIIDKQKINTELLQCNDLEKFKKLVKLGADINYTREQGYNILAYNILDSITSSNIDIIEYLLDNNVIVSKYNISQCFNPSTNDIILKLIVDKVGIDFINNFNNSDIIFGLISFSKLSYLILKGLDLDKFYKDIERKLELPNYKSNKDLYKDKIKIHIFIIKNYPNLIKYLRNLMDEQTKQKYEYLLDCDELGLL